MDPITAYAPAPGRHDRMPHVRAGASGLRLPRVSLGLWHNFGENADERVQRATLRAALDEGLTHFDLANNYGPPYGAAESAFGRHLARDLRPFRDEFTIASKAGYDMWEGPHGIGGSRKHLIASLDQSLARMGVDYVDVFYHHCPDLETPLEETARALDHVVRSGRAQYVAVSNYSPERTAQMATLMRELGTPLTLHQVRYSMLGREPEAGLLDVAAEHGLGVVAFSPLAQGLLTDRYLDGVPADSRAAHDPRFLSADDVTDSRVSLARALAPIAAERGQSIAQLAIAWVLRGDRVASAIVGASSPEQLRATMAATANLALSAEELARIESVLAAH